MCYCYCMFVVVLMREGVGNGVEMVWCGMRPISIVMFV